MNDVPMDLPEHRIIPAIPVKPITGKKIERNKPILAGL